MYKIMITPDDMMLQFLDMLAARQKGRQCRRLVGSVGPKHWCRLKVLDEGL